MREILHVDPGDASPIWRQIEEGVRRLVVSRTIAPGAAMPSVRDLARELRVNPATVAKAYQRLVDADVLMVKRGEGTFVADSPPLLGGTERAQILHDGALRYASIAITAGAQLAEAEHALQMAWKELKSGDGLEECTKEAVSRPVLDTAWGLKGGRSELSEQGAPPSKKKGSL